MSKRPVQLEVRLQKGKVPSLENNEGLISKFLRACGKDSFLQYIYENSAYTKRFEKPSVLERRRQLEYKRKARKAGRENAAEPVVEKSKR